MTYRRSLVWLASASWVWLSGIASAAEPAPHERPHVSAAALIGGNVDQGRLAYWGKGAALRVGYTFSIPFYAGAMAAHHWGNTDEWSAGKTTKRTVSLTVELGYELHGTSWFVLPSVGLGSASLSDRTEYTDYPSSSDEHSSTLVSPGVSGGLILGRWMLGVDARAMAALQPRTRGDSSHYYGATTVHGVFGAAF